MRRALALLVAVAACSKAPPSGESSPPASVASAPLPASSASASSESGEPRPVASASALPTASASAPAPAPPPPPGECPAGMQRVTGGIFWMGSLAVNDEESPRHRVALPSYCMDTYEITVARYRACVDAGGCTPAHPDKSWCNAAGTGKDDHPINCVDWHQAAALCKHEGRRLPTEREWEFAARAGAEQRPFPWGADPPDGRSCYSHPGTCKVGSYPPTAFGLYDLGGNVWEWTDSWFGKYPEPAESGSLKVYRGGSFSRRFPKWMRNGLRNRFRPDEWGAHLGARCAADLDPRACPEGSEPRATGGCKPTGEPEPKRQEVAQAPRPSGSAAPVEAAPAPPKPETQPVTITRDPTFDDDCKRHKPGRPLSYMVKGGGFGDRQKAKGACQNRDVGVGFNSVCCAQ